MTTLREAAQQALEALEGYRRELGDQQPCDAEQALEAALAEPAQEPDSPERRCGGPGCDGTCCQPVEEPDLSRCPKCGGPADNGHDREVPPNPYYCTKCMAEPVAWRWGYRSVTTGEMDWRGYVEIPAHPNLRSPEIIMEPLYTAPPHPSACR